jgi:tRNA-2-methylthio-N6-dimethylallyladenosine synthase
MLRGYTVAEYLRLVERLRAVKPGIALSTDIIVGFPGETEADFEATLDLMRTVAFDSAFMFKYSRREGTRAAKEEETVSEAEKGQRLQAVIALQEEQSAQINRAAIGSTVEILIEGPARRRDNWLVGKTEHFKTAVVPAAPGLCPGVLAQARVVDSTAHTLVTEPLGQARRGEI